jgi:hypothetical protein
MENQISIGFNFKNFAAKIFLWRIEELKKQR